MKNVKRILLPFIICFFVLTVFAACDSQATEDEHGEEGTSTEYVTQGNGELVGERVYSDGILTKEMRYASGNDGEEDFYYITEEILYNEDGSKDVKKYDEAGELIKEVFYDDEGKKIHDYDIEYFYDDEGNPTSVEKREKGELREETVFEYDEHGNIHAEKTYKGARLVREVQYAESEYYMYEAKVITYNEDGSVTVEEFDENGEPVQAEG